MANILQIDWIDKEGLEAEVSFEVGGKRFWAFCHPCDFSEGENANVHFNFIEEEISDSAFWNGNKEHRKEIIQSKNNKCHYQCYGQLASIHPIMIDCGTFILPFGDWLNDERVLGSYVYFAMSRFDIGRIQITEPR